MLYHSGGVNKTSQQRRAINNVYTIPMIKQQINLPNILNGLYQDSPELEKLLGYTTTVPDSIEQYYNTRQKK
jgi:ectoine hydroxylase-related dioxygenase (phytanoyl-CoA dioxygenase family)